MRSMRGGAPGSPSGAAGVLDVAGEPRAVHENRTLHALAEGRAESLKTVEIGGEGGGDGDEFFVGMGGKISEIQKGELAEPGTTYRGRTCAGDDGNPHPERVQAGCVTVVGEGVEHDVGLVVELDVLIAWDARLDADAIFRNACAGENVEEVFASGGFRIEQEQAGIGDGNEYFGPEFQDAPIDLAGVIERDEGDVAIGSSGERKDGDIGGDGLIAPEGTIEAERGF
jgi:hypothetical protein